MSGAKWHHSVRLRRPSDAQQEGIVAVDLNVTYTLVGDGAEIVLATTRHGEPVLDPTEATQPQPQPQDAPNIWREILPAGSSVLAPGLSTPVL